MIYGYLRVSSDEQDVNSQKQGVVKFAADKGWEIQQYITDEGVSGGKDPSKRNLGPLLSKLEKDDILIASEISRLGRDLYMVMDILHHCMKVGCVIYTVKDRFTLGDDIQSKVLAFAFGLSAEIERQMIRQRTAEGLRLRVKSGVLLGRPPGRKTSEENYVLSPEQVEKLIEQYKWGVSQRRLAENFGIDRCTVWRFLRRKGVLTGGMPAEEREQRQREKRNATYELLRESVYLGENTAVDSFPREEVVALITANLTIPEIAERYPSLTYNQVYDTIYCDPDMNTLYRKHGQLRLVKKQKHERPSRH